MSLAYIGSRRVLVKNIKRQLTPCGAWWNRKTYLCEAGFGWDDNPRHIEGVYLTLCSWLSETSQLSLSCHELSNGRCLRVWLYHNQWSIVPILIGDITPCGGVYHIGVGSNVVCSAVSGNAKASISGTDDKQFPRFFYVRMKLWSLIAQCWWGRICAHKKQKC